MYTSKRTLKQTRCVDTTWATPKYNKDKHHTDRFVRDGTFHATKAASRQSEASEPSEPLSGSDALGPASNVSSLPLTTSFPEESCFSRVGHRPHFQTLTTLSQANAALMHVASHVVTLENLHATIDVYQLLDTFDDFGTIAYAHGE